MNLWLNNWDHIHWIILPCLNPDGYRYSYTSERYWRKNRNTNGGSSCKGVDLNRNYDIQWGLFGTSNDSTNHLLKSEVSTMWRFLVRNSMINTARNFRVEKNQLRAHQFHDKRSKRFNQLTRKSIIFRQILNWLKLTFFWQFFTQNRKRQNINSDQNGCILIKYLK